MFEVHEDAGRHCPLFTVTSWVKVLKGDVIRGCGGYCAHAPTHLYGWGLCPFTIASHSLCPDARRTLHTRRVSHAPGYYNIISATPSVYKDLCKPTAQCPASFF